MTLADKIRRGLASKLPVYWRQRPEILCGNNTVKPLHGVVPREIMGTAWWNKTRAASYASTDYHCIACGIHKYAAKYHQWLEAHEVYETDYLVGRSTYIESVPLCHYCHCYIHDGRLKALLDKGLIHHAKYAAVMQHGDSVLRDHGLVRIRYDGPYADWKDWRLVLFGKEYPPKYRNLAEWSKAHER